MFNPETGEVGNVPAGELEVGDLVWTRPEGSEEFDAYPVSAVSKERNTAVRVEFTDGRAIEVSRRHRVWCGGGWRESGDLVPGDAVDGEIPGVVEWVGAAGKIDVVRITVADAHTYQLLGLLSHNLKPRDQ